MTGKIKQMSKVMLLTMMLLFAALPAAAEKYTGRVDGKYPVVVYLNINGNKVTGKYAYTSTLKKLGDKPSSWLYIKGSTDGWAAKGTTFECTVKDNKGKYVESWVLDYYSWGIEAVITTAKGKVFHLNLN